MEQLLITRTEAAKCLNISVDTLDKLTCAGKIRRATIGSRAYFSPEELQAFGDTLPPPIEAGASCSITPAG